MLVKKEEVLSFSFKIPRDLHDEIDNIREKAKQVQATYDPTASLVRALKKDIAATLKQLEAVKVANSKKGADQA